MRAITVRGLLAATFIATAAIAACSYSPSFESGTLMCGPGASCPENYHCMASYCYRDGEGGAGGASGGRGGGGGSGGGGGGTSGVAKFIGKWNFVSPAKRVRNCPPSVVNEMVALPVDADDFIDIAAGTAGSLAAYYYCDWNVDVNAAGTATVLRPGQSCSALDSSQVPPVTFTWTGESFTLTTSDGRTGTIDASIPYSYTSTAGTGTCTATFTGPVMKN
jgi:hypothetical protein